MQSDLLKSAEFGCRRDQVAQEGNLKFIRPIGPCTNIGLIVSNLGFLLQRNRLPLISEFPKDGKIKKCQINLDLYEILYAPGVLTYQVSHPSGSPENWSTQVSSLGVVKGSPWQLMSTQYSFIYDTDRQNGPTDRTDRRKNRH